MIKMFTQENLYKRNYEKFEQVCQVKCWIFVIFFFFNDMIAKDLKELKCQ